MPRVIDLSVIESRYPHEGVATNGHVVGAAGIKFADDLERPSSGRPARGGANVGSIARIGAGRD